MSSDILSVGKRESSALTRNSNKNPRMKDISWLLLAPSIVSKNEGRTSGWEFHSGIP